MIEDVMSSSSSPLPKSRQQEAVEFSKAAAHVQSSGQDEVQSSGQGESSGQDQGQQQKEGHDLNQSPKSYYNPPEDKTTHLKNQEHRDRIKVHHRQGQRWKQVPKDILGNIWDKDAPQTAT